MWYPVTTFSFDGYTGTFGCPINRTLGEAHLANQFMRKKPEYGLAYGTQAACGGDEWRMGVWGQSPHAAFSVKRYPAAPWHRPPGQVCGRGSSLWINGLDTPIGIIDQLSNFYIAFMGDSF